MLTRCWSYPQLRNMETLAMDNTSLSIDAPAPRGPQTPWSAERRVARLLTWPAGRVGSENLQERAGRVQFDQRPKFNFKVPWYLYFILHNVPAIYSVSPV